MREFIGAGHRAVLEVLRARVRDVAAGDVTSPRVVILEGPSGVGKSRVAREVYRRMRDDYDPQGYWPELMEDFGGDGADGDPLAGRKDIGPPAAGFVWPAGVLPGFGWWQLHCDRISTGMVDVAAQASPEIQAHHVPLMLAWKKAASPGQIVQAKLDEIIKTVRDSFIKDGPVEAASQVLTHFGRDIPMFGTLFSWMVSSIKAGHHQMKLRRDTGEEVDLGQRAGATRRSVSAELAGLIRGVADARVPGVVVIEDLHLMDDALAEFLDDLAAPRQGPVVVIAMAWPEARHAGAYADWAEKAVAAERAQVVEMPHLTVDDLRHMILTYAPNTPDDVVNEAVQHLSSPLHLEAALSGAVREAIDRNGGALPPEILGRIPRSIEGVYEKRFRALTDEVQRGLAMAAGALPDPTSNRLWPFVRDIVADAADRCDLIPAAQVLDGIDYAAHERVWLIPTGVADTFREALQAHIAHQHLTDPTFISPTAETAIRHAVHTVLTERINHTRDGGYLLDPTEENSIISRWLLALTNTTDTTTDSDALLTAAYRRAMEFAAVYDYEQAANLLAAYLDGQDEEKITLVILQVRLANWRGNAGHFSEAASRLQLILTKLLQFFGPDYHVVGSTRHCLTHWLIEDGRYDEAIVLIREKVDSSKRVFGGDHSSTLDSQGQLASLLMKAGLLEESIELHWKLLEDHCRIDGIDHSRTNLYRSMLYRALEKAGQVSETIDRMVQTADEKKRVLGSDHPSAIAIRYDLAYLLSEAGRQEEAVTAWQELLADRQRSLGPDHADTLTLGTEFARQLWIFGKTAEAISALEAVLAVQERTLGAKHPATLETRGRLACWIGRAGDRDEAVVRLRSVLNDCVAVLGESFQTSWTRQQLADFLECTGQSEEAARLRKADPVVISGVDSLTTFIDLDGS